MGPGKVVLGLIVVLVAALGSTSAAFAEFSASNGNAAFFENEAGAVSLTVSQAKGGKTEAEIECGAAGGLGYVVQDAGKTGEKTSEDEPPSDPTEGSNLLALGVAFERCKETISGITEEATINATGCEFELHEEKEGKIVTSLRTSEAKTQCVMIITRGECKLEIGATTKGENEGLEGLKVKSIASEEFEIEKSDLADLKTKESGCKLEGKELEGKLEVNEALIVKQVVGPETTNFGEVVVNNEASRMIPFRNRLALTYGTANINGEAGIFARTADGCSTNPFGANSMCEIKVRFKPAFPVAYQGRLELPASGSIAGTPWSSTFVFILQGKGRAAAKC